MGYYFKSRSLFSEKRMMYPRLPVILFELAIYQAEGRFIGCDGRFIEGDGEEKLNANRGAHAFHTPSSQVRFLTWS